MLNITNKQQIPVSPCSMAAFTPAKNKESTQIRKESKPRMEHFLTHGIYEGWNFNSGNYLFTTDTK